MKEEEAVEEEMGEVAAGSEALIVSEFRVDGNPRRFFTLRPFSLGVSIYVLVFRMLLRRRRKSKNMKTLGRRREQEGERQREKDRKKEKKELPSLKRFPCSSKTENSFAFDPAAFKLRRRQLAQFLFN